MIKVFKSTKLWRHIPSIFELREACDPDIDVICSRFDDNYDLDMYFKLSGIRIFTNGKVPPLSYGLNGNKSCYIRSEYKYYMDSDKTIHHYPLKVPDQSDFILI